MTTTEHKLQVAAASADGPEFQVLAEYWRGEPYGTRSFLNAWDALIDHINAWGAQLREADQSAASRDVLAERARQVTKKDWTHEHDDAHPCGEIAAFAALYAMPPAARDWTTSETGYGDTFGVALCPENWTPKFGDRRRDLVKAGALILAEIERIDRAAAQ